MPGTQHFVRFSVTAGVLMPFCILSSPSHAGDAWVELDNQTSTRLAVPANDPFVTSQDEAQKAYAVGDFDMDGDDDVVVARKSPWITTGRRTNVLLLNEGIDDGHAIDGVLVDHTLTLATASDVAGDMGFLTPTNDFDIIAIDVDNDGDLDVVTATGLMDNERPVFSHPRVYINLGLDNGTWLGFRYEASRIPEMDEGTLAGPRFASVSAGDVNNDGFADLYFTDFDSGFAQVLDYNNRLLINDGTGHFTDESQSSMGMMFDYGGPTSTQTFLFSAFGTTGAIADVNNDDQADVIKLTTLNAPSHVAVIYNNLGNDANTGLFNDYDIVYNLSGYYVESAHLNDDGLLDLVVVDDGADRYMINAGLDSSGRATFFTSVFNSPLTIGFGGDAIVTDLNRDGHNDVLITDVEIEIPGCNRQLAMFRNDGTQPIPGFTEDTVIDTNVATGTHDIAVLDLNRDGRPDLLSGRCETTEMWINVGPTCAWDCAPTGGNGVVNIDDLLAVINAFGDAGGPCDNSPTNGDGTFGNGIVNIDDVLGVINRFGPCR
ncbi:MAG: VCBS repeat-containing protein [Planctomycetota bacterium]